MKIAILSTYLSAFQHIPDEIQFSGAIMYHIFLMAKRKLLSLLVVLGYRKDATFMTSSLPAPPEKS